ncbi:MAG: hypothetical protein ACRBB3_06085 [Alphaproteobacteria bacterium]
MIVKKFTLLMLGVLFATTGSLVFSAQASAEEERQCAVHYTRTACPGEEETSFKKCDGNASCVKHKKATTLEECQAAATKSCRNRRLNITKSKVITATWKGEAIQSVAGNDDFCLTYEKRDEEFNHCTE